MAYTTVTQSYGSSIKGVLGKKLGMTQIFDANNKMIPVTVVLLIHASLQVFAHLRRMATQLFNSVSVQLTLRKLISHKRDNLQRLASLLVAALQSSAHSQQLITQSAKKLAQQLSHLVMSLTQQVLQQVRELLVL